MVKDFAQRKYWDQLNYFLGEDGLTITEDEKLTRIKEFLKMKKISVQQECQVTGGHEHKKPHHPRLYNNLNP